MPDRTQDLKNHRQVAVACKNYTDTEIKKSEERILSIVARNNVDFIDHTNESTYRFTAPLNSKLLMLQSIAGNSNKIAPSTPSDDSVARLKVIPENTYKSQVDYIGGKSVKYNQFLINNESTVTRNGITFTNNGNGTWTVNGTSTARANTAVNLATFKIPVKLNDKIFIIGCPSGGSVSTYYLAPVFYNDGSYVTFDINNTDVGNGKIVTVTNSNVNEVRIEIIGAQDADQTVNNLLFKPELINLTEKFGAGNEPSTVETAIPLLKANGYKLDGTDTYSTGSLKHAVVSGVEYSPINLFDKSTVVNGKFYTASGEQTHEGYSHSDYIKVDSNNNYYVKNNIIVSYAYIIVCFDQNKNFIGYATPVGTNYHLWQLLPRTAFIIVNMLTSEVDTQCVNILNANHNGNYYPYVAPITKPIPSEVLALDGYGWGINDTCYNYIDFNAKKFVKKVGRIDLGSLTYFIQNDFFFSEEFNIKTISSDTDTPNVLISTYTTTNYYVLVYSGNDKVVSMYSNLPRIAIRNSSYSTPEAFKTAMSGVYLYYELATPIETDISQYLTTDFKVDLDKLYATCEMVVAEPIDMPNKVEYYGTIIHSLATAVKQDGFNVWDEEWEVGAINENGQNVPSASYIRSKNYISVSPDITYYSKTPNYNVVIFYFDINKNIISYVGSKQNTTFTTPSNCYYVRFHINMNYFSNDICINISNQDLNGTYKPYKAPITRLLPNSEAKYSWGITDGVRNTRVFCDDECNPVNEGQLDVDNQNLGGLNYNYEESYTNKYFYGTLASTKTYTEGTLPNILSTRFAAYVSAGYGYLGANIPNKSITFISNANVLVARDDNYNDKNIFKQAMNGEMLLYQKNATDTETLDDFDFSFDCEEGDTFTIIGCEVLQCYATYSFLIKEAKSNE